MPLTVQVAGLTTVMLLQAKAKMGKADFGGELADSGDDSGLSDEHEDDPHIIIDDDDDDSKDEEDDGTAAALSDEAKGKLLYSALLICPLFYVECLQLRLPV